MRNRRYRSKSRTSLKALRRKKKKMPGQKNERREKNDWSGIEIVGFADEMNEGFLRRWLNRGHHAPRTWSPQAET